MELINHLTGDLVFHSTIVILSIGLIISSLEYLFSFDILTDNSLLSWKISKYHGKVALDGSIGRVMNFIMTPKRFYYVIVLRLIFSIGLIFSPLLGIDITIFLVMVLITTFSINLRCVYGLDGSFHMNLIIITSLLIASLFDYNSLPSKLCFWFIAIQASLSYCIAGVTKINSSMWNSGEALIGIFGTNIYGNKLFFRFLSSHLILSKLLGKFIIFFECIFPIVFLLNFKYGVLILAIGVFFHLFNAIFMGLNGFLFAFVAAYPSIIFTINTVNELFKF